MIDTTIFMNDCATPIISKSKFGILIETHSISQHVATFYDAFSIPFLIRHYHPTTGELLSRRFFGFDEGTWEPVYSEDRYGALTITGASAFDAFGREVSRTDALGNAITNSYDVMGTLTSQSGATYPRRNQYDTAGRSVSLETTRDGTIWDITKWQYDYATGLVTNKLYADSSGIGYSHTIGGKPLRTTWARGAWREFAYHTNGLLAATTYSDTTPNVDLTYNTFLQLTTASNAIAHYVYQNSHLGVVTNEVATINNHAATLTRNLDHRHRLCTLQIGDNAVAYAYDSESRLVALSNTFFVAAYLYSGDNLDNGYTITLTNGTTISRAITHDQYRRHLVIAITNSANNVPVNYYAYQHDALGRIVSRNSDAFDYNARSEVTSASIHPNHHSRYHYDNIGNNLWISLNSSTNFYTANNLNQYTQISAPSVPPREPAYDADGNMLSDGIFTYTWDAENRLIAVYSNTTCIVSNAYDHQSCRIQKITPTATHTYFYDGWNLIQETIENQQSAITNRYIWGKDLSGTLQGAGGVGGLLAVSLDGTYYFPLYDNNGNITAYIVC